MENGVTNFGEWQHFISSAASKVNKREKRERNGIRRQTLISFYDECMKQHWKSQRRAHVSRLTKQEVTNRNRNRKQKVKFLSLCTLCRILFPALCLNVSGVNKVTETEIIWISVLFFTSMITEKEWEICIQNDCARTNARNLLSSSLLWNNCSTRK